MSLIGLILSFLLLFIAIFQALLALGAPYGKAAWGGQKGKVLPRNYRIASAISCIFFIFTISVVLSATEIIDLFSSSFENLFMWFLTVYLGLGIIMNAISRSKTERYWAPFIAVMFILCLIIVI